MDQERHDVPPRRDCDVCGEPMVLVSTLAASGLFPMKRIYKCSHCRFAVADTAADLGGVRGPQLTGT
jgi:hypothetical protein